MGSLRLKTIFLTILISAFLLPSFLILAETDATAARKALEEELRVLEEQIAQYDEDVSKTEQEKKTLENQIYTLRKQVERLDLQIYQSNILIKDIDYQIVDTGQSIDKTILNIADSKVRLANILRTIYEQDRTSLIEVLFSEVELSDFFDDVVALEALGSKSKDILDQIRSLKVYLEGQKESLDDEKTGLERVVKIKELQKQESQTAKQEKDYYLEITETEYQEQLKKKQEVEGMAADIRARIFDLIGVPDAPTFGEALTLAEYVEEVLGVRPALLLAVLSQESNIGKNVGQCYLKNPITGDGVVSYNGVAISRVMKPSRDVSPFLEITGALGRDPYNTLVSCPMSYGWGGAMGPAQFIPSTWVMFRNQVKGITGKEADPWDIKDAFLAAGAYLSRYGAANQTYNSEWKSAMIYFSGTSRRTRYNGYGFYGDSVMKRAANYQADIDALR